jgi:hypothetical protein
MKRLGIVEDMREVWVDKDNHTIPMVCFGVKKDHLVLSPLGARELAEKLLAASEEAVSLISKRVDEALLKKGEEDNADQG